MLGFHPIQRLLRDGFFRKVGILSGGTVISHLLLFAGAPIIGRLYGPEQFGVFAVYVPCLAFLTLAATLRFEMAIPIPKRDYQAQRLVAVTMVAVVVITSLAALVLLLFGDALLRLTRMTALQGTLLLLLVALGIEGLVRPLRSWNIRKSNFMPVAKAKVTQSAVLVVTQIGMGLLRLGPWALVFGDVLSRAAAGFVNGAGAFLSGKPPLSRRCWTGMRRTAHRYRRFPLFSTWSALFMLLIDSAPLLWLAVLFGAASSGTFAMAQRAVLGPLLILSTAITQVYITEASQVIQHDQGDLRRLFWTMARRSAGVCIGPLLILALFGPWLFETIFGAAWVESGHFMRLLAPAVFAQFVAGPVYQTLDLLQKQKWALVANGTGLGLVVLVFRAADQMDWSPIATVGAYSCVIALFNSSLFLVSALAVGSFQRRRADGLTVTT